MLPVIRGIAHLSAVLALLVLGLAVGRWLRDPELGASLLVLSALAVGVAAALRWLYGPTGIATLHPAVAGASAEPAAARADARPDLNAATLEDLVSLPGVGPVSARRILEDRAANGPFPTPQDLVRVPGFGPAKVRLLAEHVRTR